MSWCIGTRHRSEKATRIAPTCVRVEPGSASSPGARGDLVITATTASKAPKAKGLTILVADDKRTVRACEQVLQIRGPRAQQVGLGEALRVTPTVSGPIHLCTPGTVMSYLEELHLTGEATEDLVRNALSGAALASAEEHLLLCEYCRRRVDTLDRFVAGLRAATMRLNRWR